MTTKEPAEHCFAEGNEHYEEGRLEEALSAWRQGLRADPADADLHHNIGVALEETGQQAEAITHWREAIRLQPNFYAAHYYLASTWAQQAIGGEHTALWRKIRQHCQDALDLTPENAAQKAYLLRLRGLAEWDLGDRRKAIETMTQAVAVEPDQWTYERLGQMQARRGQFRASRQTFEAMNELPGVDFSEYELCHARLRQIGLIVMLVSAVLLLRRWNRPR